MNGRNFYIAETGKYGKGVFANKDFKTGELLIPFEGQTYTYDEIEDDSYIDMHVLQIDEKTYIGPSGKEDDLVNHSCNPNCGLYIIDGEPSIVALRDIWSGEEITWDYSTWVDENHWEIECQCGSDKCRGKVRDFGLLPIETQQKYLELGIVAPFIVKKLE